ncbi:MAG: nitroreductase family protein [Jiangellaceae bacterium]
MEFSQVVRRRRMVRNYDPDRPVPAEIRDRILANALHAPSAGFSQGWAFLVLEAPADRRRFWIATTPDGADSWYESMSRAPLIVVALSHKEAYLARYAEPDKGWTDRSEARWPVPYWDIDAGFAALLMLLTVVDEGLGACFFGIPPAQVASFRREFGVPDPYTPIGAVTIGYRAPDRRSPSLRRGRRPVESVVHHGHW